MTTVIKKQVLLKDYTQELNTATRGEDGTSMVTQNYSHVPGYTELEFGQKLRDAMDMVDLYVTYDAPRKGTAKIETG